MIRKTMMSIRLNLIQRPSWELVLNWRCWAVGVFWYDDTIGLELGPLGFTWYPGDDRFKRFHRSWMVFEKRLGRINLHLDVDTYTWRIGYIAAASWDHGLYLGPANLQIEYDRWNDESA
jgi:hypothetical protein